MTLLSPRPVLLSLTVAGLVLGVAGFAWVLGTSMKPTEPTLLSHRQEVDISGLLPGQFLRVDWEGTEVFVLRRTPEQIDWLKSYGPPNIEGARINDVPSAAFNNPFRSISPEYFVVGVERNGTWWSIAENRSLRYRCDDFRYSPEHIRVSAQVTFPGALYCAKMYQAIAEDFTQWPFVYDPAGRSPSRWYQPLRVPPHTIQGGTLVLSPEG